MQNRRCRPGRGGGAGWRRFSSRWLCQRRRRPCAFSRRRHGATALLLCERAAVLCPVYTPRPRGARVLTHTRVWAHPHECRTAAECGWMKSAPCCSGREASAGRRCGGRRVCGRQAWAVRAATAVAQTPRCPTRGAAGRARRSGAPARVRVPGALEYDRRAFTCRCAHTRPQIRHRRDSASEGRLYRPHRQRGSGLRV